MCCNEVTILTVFLLIKDTSLLLFMLRTWKTSIAVEHCIERTRWNMNFNLSFRDWDCTLISKHLRSVPFFYSALRIAFCFRSHRLINTRPAHSAVNHPQAAQKRAGWLTGTHSPGEFENNSINCYHISTVGVGGGENAACFLYWKLQIISPFFSRSVASLASYPHHSSTEIYQS